MRVDSLRGLNLVAGAAVVALLVAPARAQEPPRSDDGVEVRLMPPERLRVGDRTEVIVEGRVRPAGRAPLMLTPASEGQALEVVRGRMLRADAVDPAAEVLRFRVPVVARAVGTSVLRVRVRAYTCRARCRLVESTESAILRVDR